MIYAGASDRRVLGCNVDECSAELELQAGAAMTLPSLGR